MCLALVSLAARAAFGEKFLHRRKHSIEIGTISRSRFREG